MSRWAWHEKIGPRKGPIRHKSDYLTPEQEERQDKARHEREYDWIENHPRGEPIFTDIRVCMHCGAHGSQEDMRWTGTRWLCPQHYDEMMPATVM